MALDLFSDRPLYHLYPGIDELLNYILRLSIFLIYAACVGGAALVWAVMLLYKHHRCNNRIPTLVIFALFNDMLELLLNLYMAVKLLKREIFWDRNVICHTLSSLHGASIICGVHVQQMMVLESVLARRYPSCFAHVFFPSCSTVFSITAFLSCFLYGFFNVPVFLLMSVIPLIAVTVTTWIIICRKPPNENHSTKTKKPDCTLVAFATAFLIIYLLELTLYIFIRIWILLMMSRILLSIRVIIDPLLCVLVCKNTLIHTHADIRTGQESVQSESV